MKEILLATGNNGKAGEMLEFFGDDFSFLLLSDFPAVPDVEEDGQTFEENALIKAQYFGKQFQIPTLGEDSGIVLDAFPGKFGIRTRREIPSKSDEEWLEKFMDLMDGVTNRRAIFYSSMAFFDPIPKTEKVVLGTTSGIILEDLATEMEVGIPVSAVFVPDGSEKVYSAMTKEEKNMVSHRGKAAGLMKEFLNAEVGM